MPRRARTVGTALPHPLAGARGADGVGVYSPAMKLLATPLVIVLLAVSALAQTRNVDPSAVVDTLYRDHFAHEQNWETSLERNRAVFAPALLEKIDRVNRLQEATPDEIVGIDFNPFTNAQEEATGYRVTGTTREGKDAIVTVAVRFEATPVRVRVRLTPSGSGWLVANLLYDEGNLVAILDEL